MFHCNTKSVSGNMRIVGRILEKTPDTTACQHNKLGTDRINIIFCIHCNHTAADLVFRYDIYHRHILTDFNIFFCLYLIQKRLRNLFSGNVLMEEDSWSGVCTFSCKCKLAILCTHKIYISPQQITDDIVGTSDHQIDRSFIIFIMPCTHGVFKIVLVIIFTTQHADTALCQKRI